MADDATISISATLLPDEISRTISGSMTVSPDDANDKWYYKLTAVTTTSADLIAGSFLDYTAVDQDTAPTAITTSDKVKFLFVQVQSSTDGIYLGFAGETAVNSLANGVFVGLIKHGLVDFQIQQSQIFMQFLLILVMWVMLLQT